MINQYVKFNVHSSYAKQVIVLKVADNPGIPGKTGISADALGEDNRHPPKFWLWPKKVTQGVWQNRWGGPVEDKKVVSMCVYPHVWCFQSAIFLAALKCWMCVQNFHQKLVNLQECKLHVSSLKQRKNPFNNVATQWAKILITVQIPTTMILDMKLHNF